MTPVPDNLTRNQRLVLDVLSRTRTPMSAYTILDDLRGAGLKAPLQVYRALEKLIEIGLAHRLESVNAFVACSHAQGHERGILAFAICGSCDQVMEFTDDVITGRLRSLSAQTGFAPVQTMIEIRGTCADCGGYDAEP